MVYGGLVVVLVWQILQLTGVGYLASRHPEGFVAPRGPLGVDVLLVRQPVGWSTGRHPACLAAVQGFVGGWVLALLKCCHVSLVSKSLFACRVKP